MKKVCFTIMAVAFALCFSMQCKVHAKNGTIEKNENQVYVLSDEADLIAFQEKVNDGELDADAILDQDIICSSENKIPIGNDSKHSYIGTFDGKGFIIKNFTIDKSDDDSADNQGLFGYLGEGGIIQNLIMSEGNIKTGGRTAGGIVSYNLGSVINCENNNSVECFSFGGGIVGQSGNGTSKKGIVRNCKNTAAITTNGNGKIGGIVANNTYEESEVVNCINTGNINVAGNSFYGGGIVGVNYATVKNCFASCEVKAEGQYKDYNGIVIGSRQADTSDVEDCYYNSSLSDLKAIGLSSAAGTVINLEGKTTEELKSGETAYLLSKDNQGIWGQEIGTDELPGFSDVTVYEYTKCEKLQYSNDASLSGKVIGHNWSAWTQAKAPSYDTEGEDIRTCTECQKEEKRTIAKLEKKDISSAIISGIVNCNYTGNPWKQLLVVTLDGTILKEGIDYEVSYTNNTQIGTASIQITGINNYKGNSTRQFQILVSKNKSYVVNGQKYKVTNTATNGTGTVNVSGNTKSKSKQTTLSIANTIKIGGKTFKITGIENNAWKDFKKLKKVTIGSNVTTIGSKAFYNCKKLKTITIKSKKLKSVKSNAIKNIYKKAKIHVPSSKRKAYKKLFKKKTGFKASMKIK